MRVGVVVALRAKVGAARFHGRKPLANVDIASFDVIPFVVVPAMHTDIHDIMKDLQVCVFPKQINQGTFIPTIAGDWLWVWSGWGREAL